jgi:tRNA dimethylallyltransferase
MQVYGDLRVLTARPTAAEEARVPHRLYGHVDAGVDYSVGRWLADAAVALAEAEQTGRVPILVGGTGLYFKALTRGLSAMPSVPREVRTRIRDEAGGVPTPALHQLLAGIDPLTAGRLRPSDRQRILRALELFAATGRPLIDWQAQPGVPLVRTGDTVRIFLAVERAELHRRIDARFDAMLVAGALEEARALLARNLDPALPVMKAHGMPWLARHVRGEISLEDAAERGKADTRRYAKRQETWFRHQLPEWQWMGPQQALQYLLSL